MPGASVRFSINSRPDAHRFRTREQTDLFGRTFRRSAAPGAASAREKAARRGPIGLHLRRPGRARLPISVQSQSGLDPGGDGDNSLSWTESSERRIRDRPLSPEPPPGVVLSAVQRTQVERVVGSEDRATASPQLRLELMGDSASVQVALQRASTPFGGQQVQFLTGQFIGRSHAGIFAAIHSERVSKIPQAFGERGFFVPQGDASEVARLRTSSGEASERRSSADEGRR